MSISFRPVLLAGLVAFLVNPSLACVSDADFQYGEQEMRTAAEGTWDVTMSYDDGRRTSFRFALVQSSRSFAVNNEQGRPSLGRTAIRQAAACGNRDFVKSAAACTSSSSMPLEGSFVAGDAAYSTLPIRGMVVVPSTVLVVAELGLRIGEENLYGARIWDEGAVDDRDVPIMGTIAGQLRRIGSAELVRVPIPSMP